jgi:hypothetical protein
MIENISRFSRGVYIVELSDGSGKVLAKEKLLIH